LFVSQFFDKSNFHFLSVEISFKFEKVSFDAELRLWILNGRAIADVEDSAIVPARSLGANGVNSSRWQGKAGDVQVRSRKTQFMAEAVAAHDLTCEGISATQHLTGGIQVAGLNGLADAGAADGFAIERNC